MDFRVGIGTDIHRLAPGAGFMLGGVFIPCGFSVVANSDGDVLIHALVDALLGAAGKGDIGEKYPKKAVLQGERSSRFLLETMAAIRMEGWVAVNADCVVDLEMPSLKPFKEQMQATLAQAMDLPPEMINIKAKTAEGMGPVGEGKALSAQAVVLLRKKA